MTVSSDSPMPASPAKSAVLGLAAALLLSACGAAQEEVEESAAAAPPTPMDGAEAADSQPEDAAAEDAPEQEHDFPATPAGEAAEYVLSVLNAEEDSTVEDWQEQVHEDFEAELPPEELAEVINSTVRPARPWTVADHQDNELESVTRLESATGELEMQIVLDEDQESIRTLFFGEPPEPVETAESFQEIEDRLTEVPGDIRALILQDGEPLLDVGAGEPAPLASASKLYVLLAAVEAIEQGDADWEDELELTDELRSLPSGTLQDQEEGYRTSLFDVAHRMIEISDNTGTDMLIDHLGRDAVEEAAAESNHHNPEVLRPFLTTRELFQLRWGHPELGQGWAEADEQTRRDTLEQLEDMPLEITGEDVGADDVDFALDWHGTAYDLAEVHHQLAQHAQEHPELVSILGRNPGLLIGVEDPWWQDIAFKGGSVPGVLTGSWHAVSQNGQDRTVVLLAEHEDAAELREESRELFALAQDALTIED